MQYLPQDKVHGWRSETKGLKHGRLWAYSISSSADTVLPNLGSNLRCLLQRKETIVDLLAEYNETISKENLWLCQNCCKHLYDGKVR